MLTGKSTIQSQMREQLPLFVFVSVLFVMGVIFGALMVNALSPEQNQDLARYLGSFFHTIDQGAGAGGSDVWRQSFAMHFKWLALIWVLGLSVIGLPLILVLDFLKGVLIGFSVGYIVGQFSWHGVLFALVSIAPQNLIIIPAIILCSVTAVSFSVYLIKNRFLQRKGAIKQPFWSFTLLTLALIGVVFGVSLFEAFISPGMMKWITPMLQAL